MGNFFNNIFGSIGSVYPAAGFAAKTDIGFIPRDSAGGVINLRGADAVWKGLELPNMQYWAYCYCAPLASVIDRLAECDTNAVIQLLKANGDSTQSSVAKQVESLMSRPNPLQTWAEFRGQQSVYKRIFGYCPVYAMIPAGSKAYEAKYLWNLNPFYARPIANYEFTMTNGQDRIKEWNISILGTNYQIPAEKVFIIKDGYVNQAVDTMGLPLSKVAGLDFAISNICAAMEADNVLLRKKGPLGFISHDPKPDSVAGYIPMTSEDKQDIQDDLAGYGLTWSQWQYVVTKIPTKWNPMSFNVKDLATKETIRSGIDMICDRFAYPAELMSGKNATYENRSSAEKYLYQNVVMPSNVRDMRVYNNFFSFVDRGLLLSADFSDVAVLQEDALKRGQAQKAQVEGLLIQFQNSLITLNDFRKKMDIDTVEGDDIYYAEYLIKYKVNENEKTPSKGTGAEEKP